MRENIVEQVENLVEQVVSLQGAVNMQTFWTKHFPDLVEWAHQECYRTPSVYVSMHRTEFLAYTVSHLATRIIARSTFTQSSWSRG